MDLTYLSNIELLSQANERNIPLMSPLDRHNVIRKILTIDRNRQAHLDAEHHLRATREEPKRPIMLKISQKLFQILGKFNHFKAKHTAKTLCKFF